MKLNDLPSTAAALEPQEISRDVLAERFLRGDEKTADDVRRRTSRALASVEAAEHRDEWAERFYEAQCRGVVLAGRINSAAGTDIRATLINCFVQGIGDSVSDDVDGKPSIYKARPH